MVSFRVMDRQDIADGLRLCRSANWNQLQRDWEIFLSYGADDCLVALVDDKVAGTATAIRYEGHFSWIGMVLVDPGQQRKGVGSGLLKQAMDLLSGEETIKLDATPAGREVYLPLHFKDEYGLSRMSATIEPGKLPDSTAVPMQQNDLPEIAEFDSGIFGAARLPLLEWFYEGAPELAFIKRNGQTITGYCLGRKGYRYTQVGPLVANDWETAKDLAAAAFRACGSGPAIVDALLNEPKWLSWLAETGFTEQRPFTRMYLGKNHFPGDPTKQFAIAGPEFG